MKVMLVTGYISYESFSESSYYDTPHNPLHPDTAKVYDISTEDKYKKAMFAAMHLIVEKDSDDVKEDIFYSLIEENYKPKEPKINLSDAHNAQKINKIQKNYQVELNKYHRAEKANEKIRDFVYSSEDKIAEYPLEYIEKFFLKLQKNNEEAPRVYIYEVE